MHAHYHMKLPGTVSGCLVLLYIFIVLFFLYSYIMYSYIPLGAVIIIHYNKVWAVVIE